MGEDTTHHHRGLRFVSRLRRGASRGGEPIFFLSGAFQTMDSWARTVEHFHPRHDVLVADLPGTGDADLLPSHEHMDVLAEYIALLLDHYRLPRVTIISASYGTPIAYQFAQRHPERLSGLVLSGTMRAFPEDRRDAARRSLELLKAGKMDAFAAIVTDSLLCNDPERPIERGRLAKRLLSGQLKAMPIPAREKYLANTERLLHHPPLDLTRPPRVRTLVFTGEHDVFTTPAYCREIAAAIPGSQFTTIREADHLFHIERFDATIELLDRFVHNAPLDDHDGILPAETFPGDALHSRASTTAHPQAEELPGVV